MEQLDPDYASRRQEKDAQEKELRLKQEASCLADALEGAVEKQPKEAGLHAPLGVGAPGGSAASPASAGRGAGDDARAGASAALSQAELGRVQSVIGPKEDHPTDIDETGLAQFLTGTMTDKPVTKNITALVKA